MCAIAAAVSAPAATFGPIGLAVGLALRPVIANLTAGLTIQLNKPIKLGDWIYIDGRLAEVLGQNVGDRVTLERRRPRRRH